MVSTKNKIKSTLLMVILILVTLTPAKKNSSGGFVDFNYYYDIEDFNVLTINILSKLSNGFHYFSLTNYTSPFQDDTRLTDANGFYTEQNIRWKLPKAPIDLTTQWNIRGGNDNDRLRFGFRWLAKATPGIERIFSVLGGFYSLNFHIFQIDYEDSYVFQMEHVYKLTPFGDRFYIAGFADHYVVGEGPSDNALITEHQLGIRLIENFHIVSEWRRVSKRKESNSLGIGVQYLVIW